MNGLDRKASVCDAPLERFYSRDELANVARKAPGICSNAAYKAAEFRRRAPIDTIPDKLPHEAFDTQAAGTPLAGAPEFAKNTHPANLADEKAIAQPHELVGLGLAPEKRKVRSAHEFRDRKSEQLVCSQGKACCVWNRTGKVRAVRRTSLLCLTRPIRHLRANASHHLVEIEFWNVACTSSVHRIACIGNGRRGARYAVRAVDRTIRSRMGRLLSPMPGSKTNRQSPKTRDLC